MTAPTLKRTYRHYLRHDGTSMRPFAQRSYSICVHWLVRDIPARLPAVAVKGGRARSHEAAPAKPHAHGAACFRARKQAAMTVFTIGGARCSWRASRNKRQRKDEHHARLAHAMLAARHARCCGTPSARIELAAPGGFPAGREQRPGTVSRSPTRTRGARAGQT